MRSLLLFVFSIAIVPALRAQSPSARFTLVTVTEVRGRAVTGLDADVFRVTENGINRPVLRVVEVVNREPETPASQRNQYRIDFDSLTPSGAVAVSLDQPRGMPKLQVRRVR